MNRIPQLDGLRALAFLCVFLHHAYHIPLLWMGVDLFFVLSGYLITTILVSKSSASPGTYFGQFYQRRAYRILPPYCLMLAISAALFHFDWAHIWYWYVFFSANIGEAFSLAGGGVLQPLWSLAVEEHFYLVWPVLVYFLRRSALTFVLIAILVFAPILRGLATNSVSNFLTIYFLTPFRCDLLAAGALISLHWETFEEFSEWSWMSALLSLGIFALLSTIFPDFKTSANSVIFNVLGYSLSVVLFSSVLIYCLKLRSGFIHQALSNSFLTYLGKISYMMYLIHEVAIELCRGLGIVTGPIAILVTVGFSSATWFMLEKPILHRGRDVRQPSSETAEIHT